MDDMIKIIRINAYIQRKMGTLRLDGKEIECVALDYTCTFKSVELDEIILTDEQLQHLFLQTFGVTP